MTLIEQTRVYCPECRGWHPASLLRDGKRVIGRVECPSAAREVLLANDADTYLWLRSRSQSGGVPRQAPVPSLINLLPVTEHCNLKCPVCYASAGPQAKPSFLPVAEVVRRMEALRRSGGKALSLTGGEAVLHPDIGEIVRRGRSIGLRMFVVTNGVAFADDAGLAGRLRAAGLSKVLLQWDAMDGALIKLMRGIDLLAEKERAAQSIVAAGLRLSMVATITRHNLNQVGPLAAKALSMGPAVVSLTLQAACLAGRFDLGGDATVHKEEILTAVWSAPGLAGAGRDEVWPLPRFAPWGLDLHPDCGCNMIALHSPGEISWLGGCLDLPQLHRRMAAASPGRAWWRRNLVPLGHLLAAARPGKRATLLRHLRGFLTGRGTHGMLVIGMGAFCERGFLDQARLDGCATSELTSDGPVSPCLRYGAGILTP